MAASFRTSRTDNIYLLPMKDLESIFFSSSMEMSTIAAAVETGIIRGTACDKNTLIVTSNTTFTLGFAGVLWTANKEKLRGKPLLQNP